MKPLNYLRLFFISLISFVVSINGVLLHKTLSFLISGVLSFAVITTNINLSQLVAYSSPKQLNVSPTNFKKANSINNKLIDDKPLDDKPLDDKPLDDKPLDDKPLDDKPLDEINNTPTPEITQHPCQLKENQNNPECQIKQANSGGDPHINTFDGLSYSLQTVGEFILVKAEDSKNFEIQTRHAALENSNSMSLNSAVAMKVGEDRVALYAQSFPDQETSNPLRVNGKPTTIQGDKLQLSGGGEILKQGNTYVVNFPMGEKAVISPVGVGANGLFNISVFAYNKSGKYSGLLGNLNGDPKDDQQIRGEASILEVRSTYGDLQKVLNGVGLRTPGVLDRAEQIYFEQLNKKFGNSWRLKQEESLFDYPVGNTTENYTDPTFPAKYLTLNMLSPQQIQKARDACVKAKVSEDLMEGCLFDVGFSGLSEFAIATAEISEYVSMVNQLFPGLNLPVPSEVINRVIDQVKPKKVCLPMVGCL